MSGLRCRLLDRTGRELSGEVVGLDVDKASVVLRIRFGPAEEVSLPLGDTIELALFGPTLYKPHTFQGRPVRRTNPNGQETYGFRVDPARRFELELVVGGRSTLRVQPKVGQPVTVEMRVPGHDEVFSCPLHDASVTGMSVGIDWGDEKRLVLVREVQLLMHLPGVVEPPTPIPARIRRRTVDGEQIVYGLEIDEGLVPAGNASLRDLAAWVEERYQELSGGARVLRRTG